MHYVTWAHSFIILESKPGLSQLQQYYIGQSYTKKTCVADMKAHSNYYHFVAISLFPFAKPSNPVRRRDRLLGWAWTQIGEIL